jgi:hypothetical protein
MRRRSKLRPIGGVNVEWLDVEDDLVDDIAHKDP